MRPYSMDLRERVIADCDEGLGTTAVAQKYRVSESWVRGLKRRRRETGEIGPRKQRTSHATKLDDHLDQLNRLVEERPDATLVELRDELGVPVAPTTVWRALRRLQLTFKKKWSMPVSKTAPTFKPSARSGKPRRLAWTPGS